MGMMCVALLISDILAIIITGIAGMLCWNWFVPELFLSAPQMTFATSVGLAIVCSIFVSSGRQFSKEDIGEDAGITLIKALYSQFVNGISKPIILIVIGWIVHSIAF